MSLVANGTSFQHLFPEPVRLVLAFLPLAVGALMVLSYARFVRQADELQKAIHLSALAIGFGATIVFTLAYPALQRIGLPQLEPNHFIAVGVLSYLAATSIHSIRYE